jgi:hypothetical protein
MDGTGEHHLMLVSEGQKSHKLPHMWIRPKINAVILLDMGHILKGNCTQRDRARERNQKLECGAYAHCVGMNIVILNCLRPLWEGN